MFSWRRGPKDATIALRMRSQRVTGKWNHRREMFLVTVMAHRLSPLWFLMSFRVVFTMNAQDGKFRRLEFCLPLERSPMLSKQKLTCPLVTVPTHCLLLLYYFLVLLPLTSGKLPMFCLDDSLVLLPVSDLSPACTALCSPHSESLSTSPDLSAGPFQILSSCLFMIIWNTSDSKSETVYPCGI